MNKRLFNGREVEGKPLFYPPLHHCRKNTNVSMVGKLEEKLIFQPPKQIRPSEKYELFHGRNGEGNIHILSTSWSIVRSQVGPVLKKSGQMEYYN